MTITGVEVSGFEDRWIIFGNVNKKFYRKVFECRTD